MTNEKKWIKIHSGLTNDPKHREAMGVRVWLFMWLVDHADWETGIVVGYTDAAAGADNELDMPSRTVEGHRQRLEADGYIKCHAGFQCQHIRIMRWRNPKQVEAKQINIPDDKTTWYAIPRTHPSIKPRTLTIDHKQTHTTA